MNKLVDLRVRINLYPYKGSAFVLSAFEAAARDQGWCDTDIELALSQTKGLSRDAQFEVLLHYCMTYGDDVSITQQDVVFMLSHLGCQTHYLNHKVLETWDEYDWSNYNSLKRKATSSVKRAFALFSNDVEEKDKYIVSSPPRRYYETLEEAQANVTKENESSICIYSLWIKS